MTNHLAAAALVAVAAIGMGAPPASAQEAKTLRIGVFDSRAVALAYGRSENFQRSIESLRGEYEKAKAANDANRVKELQNEGEWTQVRLHQQVFSDGPVSSILDKVKDKLTAIAEQAGVTVIVSKWAMPFQGAGVEAIDVTLALVKLFNPSAQTMTYVEQMKSKQPISFEKLPLDPNI